MNRSIRQKIDRFAFVNAWEESSMKKLLALAATAALTACSQAEAPPEPVDTAAAEPAPVATTANGTPAGDFEVLAADGTVSRTSIRADGTYSAFAPDGAVAAEGNWAVTNGKTCFTPATDGVEAMCFTDSPPAADGSFTATPDKGEPVTVRPAAAPVSQ